MVVLIELISEVGSPVSEPTTFATGLLKVPTFLTSNLIFVFSITYRVYLLKIPLAIAKEKSVI